MQLGRGDIVLVETLLAGLQGCRVILEFGAGTGLQTTYWGLAMALRQGDVHVFNPRRPPYSTFWPANIRLYLDPAKEPPVESIISNGPALIIIDGLDRLARVRQVADSAPADSVLLVHDWITRRWPEFCEEAAGVLTDAGWARLDSDLLVAAALCSRFAVWRRTMGGGDHGGQWCHEQDEDPGGEWCHEQDEDPEDPEDVDTGCTS